MGDDTRIVTLYQDLHLSRLGKLDIYHKLLFSDMFQVDVKDQISSRNGQYT